MKKLLLLFISLGIMISCKPQEKAGEEPKEEKKAPQIEINQEIFSAEMLMSLKRIGGAELSPDSKWVLFDMKTPNIPENSFATDLYKVSIDGGEIVRLTEGHGKNYNGIWSPDGAKIAFISTESETPQIYTMDTDGKNIKKVTELENGVSNLAYSPDGKHFSFTSEVKFRETIEEDYPTFPLAKVRIYESVPVRHWDEWVDENVSHLFVIPVEGGEPVDLTEGMPFDTPLKPFGGGEQIAWSPDGKEIAYVMKKLDGIDFVEQTNSDIFIIPAGGGEAKNITEGMMGFDLDPLYSPDGKYIAFISMENNGFESDRHRLMLYDRETGAVDELSKTFDNWVSGPAWAPDSKALYFTAGTEGKIQIFKMLVEDGSWKAISEGWYNHGSVSVTDDGNTLVYKREDMMHPVDIYRMPSEGGEPVQITNVNEEMMSGLKPAKITERWVDAVDGKKIHCWVLFPPDFDESKTYPMISYCQGGPQSMIGQRFHFRWNYYLMASNGYVVLLPNRRGLPGFGQEWNNAITKDWGGMPMKDILAATDELAKEPYVDENRLSSVGASAGGYAVFWLAGNHEGRFKAFISHCGVFNFESMYGSTEELWFTNWENGGPYWVEENKQYYNIHSPHRYAQNWDTPIMISTGEYDFRVPYTQSLEAYQVAQVKRIPSKLVVFPEETHFIAHPQEFIIWAKEFFGWLDKYCKNDG